MNKGMLANMYPTSYLKGTLSLSVTDLTRYLRQLMESDEILQDVWVQGEISNLTRPASGHIYFTLKDSGASLRCVMWRSNITRLKTALQDGMAVEAHGNINVYEAGGQYQLNTDSIRSKGEGVLYQEFIRLKNLLEAEGFFEVERKRSIPEFVKRIGIVTSPTGAALRDMINTLRRRNPMLMVTLAGSAVQGEGAPDGLVSAIQSLNRLVHPDLILLARGGGSIEDLWAFNDERVVRAIVASEAPIITGVGHETDFTLSDFAADLRAPTPTAAAEMATQVSINDIKVQIGEIYFQLVVAIREIQNQKRSEMRECRNRLQNCSPARRIQSSWQGLDTMTRRMITAQRHRLSLETIRLHGVVENLSSLNPLDVLKRGYAVVTRSPDNRLITQTEQVEVGDQLTVRVKNGSFPVQVSGQDQERK
ncbi:MAG TPA: exodeoxyribonuclease VII large subunit [Anaerolineae bacterium]|nr:exodeoxyribonuclease VII large subunit [Anaerolineae bacterium]HCC78069.1 exodeoxyribonuclease VII large subunit [Anaerolineae bacterium]HCM96295.1 exodeoxyribonuclease VII large subunit [Anaerolineae bacterium]